MVTLFLFKSPFINYPYLYEKLMRQNDSTKNGGNDGFTQVLFRKLSGYPSNTNIVKKW